MSENALKCWTKCISIPLVVNLLAGEQNDRNHGYGKKYTYVSV